MSVLNEQAQKAISDIIKGGDDAIVKLEKQRIVVVRSTRKTAYKETPPEEAK